MISATLFGRERLKLTKGLKFGQNDQILNILEFSRNAEYDFFKEN